MIIWEKEGKPDIEQRDDDFWQNGEPVDLTISDLTGNGWKMREAEDPNAEPMIETITSRPSSAINSYLDSDSKLTEFGLPLSKALGRNLRTSYEEAFPNSPVLHELGGWLGALGGGAIDVGSFAYSPVKIAGTAGRVALGTGAGQAIKAGAEKGAELAVKAGKAANPSFNAPAADKALGVAKEILAGGRTPGGSGIPAAKSLPAIGARNFAQNAGDAALLETAQKAAEGKDMTPGAGTLLGGMAGGTMGTAAQKVLTNKALKGIDLANRSNNSINFAESLMMNRARGVKGQQAVENAIDANLKKFGTIDNSVAKFREMGDAQRTKMQKFLEANGAKEIPVDMESLYGHVDDYVINATAFLGAKDSDRYANAALDMFGDQLRIVLAKRIANSGENINRGMLNSVKEMSNEDVFKSLGHMTLNEINDVKRHLQKKTSHYSRSKGSMAREGEESLSSKEAADSLNDLLSAIGNFEFGHLNETAGSLPPAAAAEFLKINRDWSHIIGNQNIMEIAHRANRKDRYLRGPASAAADFNADNPWASAAAKIGGLRSGAKSGLDFMLGNQGENKK